MPSTGRTVGTAEGFAPRAVLHDRGAPHAVSREQEERPRVLTFPHLPRTGVFPRVPRARAKLCTAAARQDGGTDRKQRAGGATQCLPAVRDYADRRREQVSAVPRITRRRRFIPAAAAACVGARAGPPANRRPGRPTRPVPSLGAGARLGADVMPRSVSVPFTKIPA